MKALTEVKVAFSVAVTAACATFAQVKAEGLSLANDILSSGRIVATYTGELTGSATNVVWYRCVNGGAFVRVDRAKVSGDLYNLAEDGSWLSAPLDVAGVGAYDSLQYRAVVSIDGSEHPDASTSFSLPYYMDLRNGDFETPHINEGDLFCGGGGYRVGSPKWWINSDNLEANIAYLANPPPEVAETIKTRTDYIVISEAIWKTTAPDGIIEIANADDRDDTYPGVTHSQQCEGAYHCPRAGLHDQFAELNGESVGSLYQDVMTIPGTPIRWSLMHRGRYGEDSMYVVVMSTKALLEKSIITQEMIEKIIRKEIDVPGARIWQISDGNTAWGTHDNNNDPYIVPEGQFVTRFFFVAGQTAANPQIGKSDPRGGNLLDAVSFSTAIPPPPTDDECEITIRKTVRYLSADLISGRLIPALQFRVTEAGGGATVLAAGNFTKSSDGTGNTLLTYTHTISLPANTTREVSVEELTGTAKIAGVVCAPSVAVGGDSDVPGTALAAGTGMRFTLGNAQRGIVEFTNDYRYPSPLTLWITDHADAGPGAVHLEFEPTLVDGVPLTADYVKSLASANRIRVAFADTEDKLKTAELQIATLRDPTARMSLDKGRVWITVRTPPDCTGHLAKIVICGGPNEGGVQLWEDGPCFAECNVGATKPEESGYYFWWGDTNGYVKSGTKWKNARTGETGFQFATQNCPTFQKNEEKLLAGHWIDANGNLTAENDAATAWLGTAWRMPTNAELESLLEKCTWKWTSNWNDTGVAGCVITGNTTGYTDKGIFLPATGYAEGTDIMSGANLYWTSTRISGNASGAANLRFLDTGYVATSIQARWYGLCVRPVRNAAE